MDLKRLVTQFAYRIEPKPEGGFIARAGDPSVPPIEAATREELCAKIQEKISASLAAEFPSFKLAPDGAQRQFAFHIERNPSGGFSIHSADPNAGVIHAATENDLESHFLEKVVSFAGRHLMPELAQALAAQGLSGDVKVVINGKSAITLNPGAGTTQSAGMQTPSLFTNANPGNLGGTIDGSPITPEASNFGKVLRVMLAFLVIAALIYFFYCAGRGLPKDPSF
ncbi:MAG TPA: hypothetical protein VFD30_21965 [Terriglobia bacterium]|nr:hypothetical protein [Terriglobia bacterium]